MMKLSLKLLSVVALFCLLLTYSGCHKKKDNPPPVTDTQIDLLSAKTWKVSSVTKDAVPQTGYSAFTLVFSGTHGSTTVNYTATGRPVGKSPWPASGTFTFSTATPQTAMTRNDGTDSVPFTYSVTGTQLQLNFSYNGDGFTTRVAEVKGQWSFTMVPG